MSVANLSSDVAKPWWKHGMVWMVILGPLAVVIAGIATAYIAIQHADVVLDTRIQSTEALPHTPSLAARNHAATPDQDVPVPSMKKP